MDEEFIVYLRWPERERLAAAARYQRKPKSGPHASLCGALRGRGLRVLGPARAVRLS